MAAPLSELPVEEASLPLITAVLVMKGPATEELLEWEAEAELLEGVAELAELIRGLLLVAVSVLVAVVAVAVESEADWLLSGAGPAFMRPE